MPVIFDTVSRKVFSASLTAVFRALSARVREVYNAAHDF